MHRVLVLVALLGCRDRQLASLEDIRTEVCACKTVACGEAAMKKVPQDKLASNHKVQGVAREMMSCLAALNAADRPSTDVDEEAPATSPGSADPASAGTP